MNALAAMASTLAGNPPAPPKLTKSAGARAIEERARQAQNALQGRKMACGKARRLLESNGYVVMTASEHAQMVGTRPRTVSTL